MIVRKIEIKDNIKVKDIIQQSLRSLGLDIPGTAYFDPQLSNLYDYYNSLPHACYWVVEINNDVVGGVGIAPYNEQLLICELQKLYLAPQAQGAGIAHILMNTALSFAAKHYDQCYLETLHKLVPACSLYVKNGFTLLEVPLDGSPHSAMDAWYIKQLN